MPSQQRLNQLFTYNPNTGLLFRKVRLSHNTKMYRPVGSKTGEGYLLASADGSHQSVHRIIWTLVNGAIPPGLVIDHINHKRDDNRIANLRCITPAENMRNMRKCVTNRTGITGVYPTRDRWAASIFTNRRKIHLGVYASYEEAIAARRGAEVALEFHPNHGKVVN